MVKDWYQRYTVLLTHQKFDWLAIVYVAAILIGWQLPQYPKVWLSVWCEQLFQCNIAVPQFSLQMFDFTPFQNSKVTAQQHCWSFQCVPMSQGFIQCILNLYLYSYYPCTIYILQGTFQGVFQSPIHKQSYIISYYTWIPVTCLTCQSQKE